jgi:hypothetical protein
MIQEDKGEKSMSIEIFCSLLAGLFGLFLHTPLGFKLTERTVYRIEKWLERRTLAKWKRMGVIGYTFDRSQYDKYPGGLIRSSQLKK